MNVAGERWVVVPGKTERVERPIGTAGHRDNHPIVDEVRHPTVIFHVPAEFARAWRENRP